MVSGANQSAFEQAVVPIRPRNHVLHGQVDVQTDVQLDGGILRGLLGQHLVERIDIIQPDWAKFPAVNPAIF